MCFFEGGDRKVSLSLKFEGCEHRDDTYIVDGDQEGVKWLIVFCVQRPSAEKTNRSVISMFTPFKLQDN